MATHPLLNLDTPLGPEDGNPFGFQFENLSSLLRWVHCSCPDLSRCIPCGCEDDRPNRFFESGIEHLRYDADELTGPAYSVVQNFGFLPSIQNNRSQTGNTTFAVLYFASERNLAERMRYLFSCKLERLFQKGLIRTYEFAYCGLRLGASNTTKTPSKHWRSQQSFTLGTERNRADRDIEPLAKPECLDSIVADALALQPKPKKKREKAGGLG